MLWSFFLDLLYDVSVGRYVRAVGWLVDHLGEREEVLVVESQARGEGGKLVGGLWQSKALVQVLPKALSSPS